MYHVFCLANEDAQAVRILDRLQRSGFSGSDVSVLHSDRRGDINTENSTKTPEGASIGAGAGAVLGGTLGWLAGIGALAIPGLGPLIAAGPILGALSGLAVGGTAGGLAGGLIGMGIPEYEAQQYEHGLGEGKVLISVNAATSEQASQIREILSDEHAEAISTSSEMASSHH